MTTKILDFFKEPESAPYQIAIYQKFVAEWEDKINKLSLVTIALQAAHQFKGKKKKEGQEYEVYEKADIFTSN